MESHFLPIKVGYLSQRDLILEDNIATEVWNWKNIGGKIPIEREKPLIIAMDGAGVGCGCEIGSTFLHCDNDKTSRIHTQLPSKPCRFIYRDNDFWIQNLVQEVYFKTTDHVYLNGVKMVGGEQRLSSGDVISLGKSPDDPDLLFIYKTKRFSSHRPNIVWRFTIEFNYGGTESQRKNFPVVNYRFLTQNPLLVSKIVCHLSLHDLKRVRLVNRTFFEESAVVFYSKAEFRIPDAETGDEELWSFVKENYGNNSKSLLKRFVNFKSIKLHMKLEQRYRHGNKGDRFKYLGRVASFIENFGYQFEIISCILETGDCVNAFYSILQENSGNLKEVYLCFHDNSEALDQFQSITNKLNISSVKSLKIEFKLNSFTSKIPRISKRLFRIFPHLKTFIINSSKVKENNWSHLKVSDTYPRPRCTADVLEFMEKNHALWEEKIQNFGIHYTFSDGYPIPPAYFEKIIILDFVNLRSLELSTLTRFESPDNKRITVLLRKLSENLEKLFLGFLEGNELNDYLKNESLAGYGIPPLRQLITLTISIPDEDSSSRNQRNWFYFVDEHNMEIEIVNYQHFFPKLRSMTFKNQDTLEIGKLPLDDNSTMRPFLSLDAGSCESLIYLKLPKTYRNASDPELHQWLQQIANIFSNVDSYPINAARLGKFELIIDHWDCNCKPY